VKSENKICSRTWKHFLFQIVGMQIVFLCLLVNANAQNGCPNNIDFESGTFTNWTCYSGNVSAGGGQNQISLSPLSGPIPDIHTMYSSSRPQSDFFGGFPVNCPNGSGHSIRLGNNQGGAQAEGISYEFTIPPNRNTYSLTYHYAVVFQDPHHQAHQQPRLEIEAKNMSDDQIIYCSSFTFRPFGSILPGFYVAPIQQDTTDVWCKDWTAVSINLNGLAGKTIRLFFKTADCTFTRHFGYAYIDVNSECAGGGVVGASFCPDDSVVNVTAPFGYQSYAWYANNFTQFLGSTQSVSISPPPRSGTVIAVKVIPYNGYGCLDTVYTTLKSDLVIQSNAGKDTFSCNGDEVPIGANSIPGLSYRWSPTVGLNNPNISNPIAKPQTTTAYQLTTRNSGGGCLSLDTVIVQASIVDTSLRLLGKLAFCITTGDSAVLFVQPTNSIQWFKNNGIITGANSIRYRATQSGTYYALLKNNKGCSLATSKKDILIEIPKPSVRYTDKIAAVNFPLQLQARTFAQKALWKPGIYLNDTLSFTPIFKGQEDRLYTVRLETVGGCVSVDTQLVKVYKDIDFYVPTAFTPNGDGLNDYLRPVAAGIKEFHYFRIYNRWGDLLFDLSTNPIGWDGNYKGNAQQTQTVVWVAEGIGADGQLRIQRGSTILIR
jgi:gliding motility-associated-like protein